jgi:hypothetical protein
VEREVVLRTSSRGGAIAAASFIGVSRALLEPHLRELFAALRPILDVSLVSDGDPDGHTVARIVDADEQVCHSRSFERAEAPRWILRVRAGDDSTLREGRMDSSVAFADDPAVPGAFRGRTLTFSLPSGLQGLRPRASERVLASAGDRALWLIDESSPNGTVFSTEIALPRRQFTKAASDGEWHADGDRILDWVPLLEFLRRAAPDARFNDPPLRAAFVIDDPNLHWPTYGYANYRDIGADAERNGYHVAFATIPLDAWFTHRESARIFQRHATRMSLLVHGNNHGKHELAREHDVDKIDALLGQALSRVERLESASRISVCRVMVPPHGACSAATLRRLPLHGFEAACVSGGSLRAHNPGHSWVPNLGIAPVELVEECPVLPRWAFSTTTDASLALAAYLGKPLILRGHHQDLREGLDLFRTFASRINALGPVEWASLTRLSRLSFHWRQEGSLLRVKPWSSRISVIPPTPETAVVVDGDQDHWLCSRSSKQSLGADPTSSEPTLTLTYKRDEAPIRRLSRSFQPLRSSVVLRRVLTETRDRLFL